MLALSHSVSFLRGYQLPKNMSESDDSTECLEAPIFGEIRGENCAVVRISRPSPLNSVISSDTNQVLNESETLDTDPQSPLSVGQETSPIESDLQESPQEQKAVISRLTQRHYVSHVQMFKGNQSVEYTISCSRTNPQRFKGVS